MIRTHCRPSYAIIQRNGLKKYVLFGLPPDRFSATQPRCLSRFLRVSGPASIRLHAKRNNQTRWLFSSHLARHTRVKFGNVDDDAMVHPGADFFDLVARAHL